jgi:hypothetical protein
MHHDLADLHVYIFAHWVLRLLDDKRNVSSIQVSALSFVSFDSFFLFSLVFIYCYVCRVYIFAHWVLRLLDDKRNVSFIQVRAFRVSLFLLANLQTVFRAFADSLQPVFH